jgi:hypothetical protein
LLQQQFGGRAPYCAGAARRELTRMGVAMFLLSGRLMRASDCMTRLEIWAFAVDSFGGGVPYARKTPQFREFIWVWLLWNDAPRGRI